MSNLKSKYTCYCNHSFNCRYNFNEHLIRVHTTIWENFDRDTLPKKYFPELDIRKDSSKLVCSSCNEDVVINELKSHWQRKNHLSKLYKTNMLFLSEINNIVYFNCNVLHCDTKSFYFGNGSIAAHFKTYHSDIDLTLILDNVSQLNIII